VTYIQGVGGRNSEDKSFPCSVHCADFQTLAAMSTTQQRQKFGQDKSIKFALYVHLLHASRSNKPRYFLPLWTVKLQWCPHGF